MWQDWIQSPVTKAVNEAIKQRIYECQVQLSGTDNDREFDLVVKGMIRAFSEFLDIKLDDMETSNHDN